MLNKLLKTTSILAVGLFFAPFINASENKISVAAPTTPSSLPLARALESVDNTTFTSFINHEKINAMFVRGEIDFLLTGLTPALNLAKRDSDIVIIASTVAKVSYIIGVPNTKKGEAIEIAFPFRDSPMETTFKAIETRSKAPLSYRVQYTPPQTALSLLVNKKIDAIAVPEPLATVALKQVEGAEIMVDFESAIKPYLNEKWNGYPQVVLISKRTILEKKDSTKLLAAIESNFKNYDSTNEEALKIDIKTVELEQPLPIIKESLTRTRFHYYSGEELFEFIKEYMNLTEGSFDDKLKNSFLIKK